MKLAKFVSYFFHPINFSIIGAILYFVFLPKYIYKPQEYLLLTIIFIGTYLFPLILIYLMKKTHMIDTYHMITIEERKFPLLLCIAISIFIGKWIYETSIVDLLALFYFGYGLCLIIIYLFLHLKQKISLHTAAIGGLIAFLVYFSYYYKINLIYILAFLFVLAGFIASARLKMKAHTLKEVILGFLISFTSQILVYLIYIYNI